MDAQQVAERRRREARAKSCKLNRPETFAYAQERLRQCCLPDQIAGRSRREFPGNPERTCSRQTIHSWLVRDDHRRRWIVYLRHYRRKYRRTKSAGHVDRALEKRPAIVNERGHFLVFSQGGGLQPAQPLSSGSCRKLPKRPTPQTS